MITWLGVGWSSRAAVADAALGVVQRWCASRIGEGLIYDLRAALFDKVQRMPIAFFTRTPDRRAHQPAEQRRRSAPRPRSPARSAASVSNVVVLVTTLVAMLALEWRLTLLALVVLPLFIIPARRVGRGCRRSPASRWSTTPR